MLVQRLFSMRAMKPAKVTPETQSLALLAKSTLSTYDAKTESRISQGMQREFLKLCRPIMHYIITFSIPSPMRQVFGGILVQRHLSISDFSYFFKFPQHF